MLRGDTPKCPDDGADAEFVETLPVGTKLGVYRIDRVLGEGGMGFVYEATHEVLNRRTAIKMLRSELASNEQIVTRFLNEAKAVNLIQHQNIVNVYDYGDSHDGSVYFIMEYLEGETLDDLMRRRRPMPLPLLLHVFGQVAKALAAAHAKAIVHRDLKPANIFVVAREDNPYFIKLLDFGIAQLRGAGAVQGLTLAGSVMGTPQYMSPEQVSGGTIDARADVWAMGVMLYRAATGESPFKGDDFVGLADQILHRPPPPAGQRVQMPASLDALISSCLERRVEARCASVGELLAGLERVKRECQLDDDRIFAAVIADLGTLGESISPIDAERTRNSVAGSLPQYQINAPGPGAPARIAAPHKRARPVGLLAVGAVVVVLGGGAYWKFGKGEAAAVVPGEVIGRGELAAGLDAGLDASGEVTVKALYLAGKVAEGRALAEAHLRDALANGNPQQQGFAIDALRLARLPATAPMLYPTLAAGPALRVKAARALGAIGLRNAAPKVRAALSNSGDAVKVELAAVGYVLGDKDARGILLRAAEEPGKRRLAAVALATAGDDAGRKVLRELVSAYPAGSEGWRAALAGLLKLGDKQAVELLRGELAQADPKRAVGAAIALAQAPGGDQEAAQLLQIDVKDASFSRRGEAAVALARLGDPVALSWVDVGFASPDLEERLQALEICAALGAKASLHLITIATLATDDFDLSARRAAEAVLLGM